MQYIWYTLTVMLEWMLIEFILKVHVRDIYCLTIYCTLKMKSGVVTAYFRSHWWLKNKYADSTQIWIPEAKNTARISFMLLYSAHFWQKPKKFHVIHFTLWWAGSQSKSEIQESGKKSNIEILLPRDQWWHHAGDTIVLLL